MNILRNTVLCLTLILGFIQHSHAQVKIGGNSLADDRSILELESDNKALQITRLTNAQRDAKSSWEVGHIIYNTSDSCFQFYDGNNWECLSNTRNGNRTLSIPRRDSATIAGISNVRNGEVVYNTTKDCLQIFIDGEWLCLSDFSFRQAQGGGAQVSLFENCGCGDFTTVVGGTSSSPTLLTTAFNNYCGVALSISSTSTAYFRLPPPANYKDQYFCLVVHGWANSNSIAYLSQTSSNLAVMHWRNLLKGEGLTNIVAIHDPSNTRMVLAKVYSNGTYWFFGAGY